MRLLVILIPYLASPYFANLGRLDPNLQLVLPHLQGVINLRFPDYTMGFAMRETMDDDLPAMVSATRSESKEDIVPVVKYMHALAKGGS